VWKEQSRIVRAGFMGILSALTAIFFFSVFAGFALSHQRVVGVVRTALAHGDLPYDTHPNQDFITECALLEMQYLRPESVLLNTIETRVTVVPGMHLCQSLRVLVMGSEAEKASLPAPIAADHYFFGSRFLEAFSLSVFDYRTSEACYRVLSYASILLLFVAMLWRSRPAAIILFPIPIVLLCAFGLHLFGQNLGHAPSFFVGFFALTLLVGARKTFQQSSARFFFFGVLGVLTTYFDLLTGSIPLLFGLSIIADHFFYSACNGHVFRSALSMIKNAAAIAACFIASYALLTVLRLSLLTSVGFGPAEFLSALVSRFGPVSYSGTPVTFADVASRLWHVRFQLTAGGAEPATWVLFFALSSAIFALLAFPIALYRQRHTDTTFAVDFLVLFMAAAAPIAWYAILPGHTYTHALFAVRTTALPAGCAIAMGVLVFRNLFSCRGAKFLFPAMALTSAVVALVLIGARWAEGSGPQVTMARFITGPVDDLVSCAPLGLRPDGQMDGIIELRYRRAEAPAALLGLIHDPPTYIRLERQNPVGVYETGSASFVLGISTNLPGKLINQSDGSLRALRGGEQHLYGHYCKDKYDTAQSVYRIDIDGLTVSVAQR
jgi:hypothetical protein